jgi:hypothetical protein
VWLKTGVRSVLSLTIRHFYFGLTNFILLLVKSKNYGILFSTVICESIRACLKTFRGIGYLSSGFKIGKMCLINIQCCLFF